MSVGAPTRNISVVQSPNTVLPLIDAQLSQLRVLLVDDTHINLKVFGRMLEKLHIGKVVTTDSGPKALALLRSDPEGFDLVITDLHMPEMQGTELSTIIRNESVFFHCGKRPLVVGLTADQNESVEAECRAAGMSLVLHKPITQHGLSDFFAQFVVQSGMDEEEKSSTSTSSAIACTGNQL